MTFGQKQLWSCPANPDHLPFFPFCGVGFVASIRFNVASRTLAVSAGVRSS